MRQTCSETELPGNARYQVKTNLVTSLTDNSCK